MTGLELANASLLDEGTAAAEAMAMAHRVSKTKARACSSLIGHPSADDCGLPKTRAAGFGFELVLGDPATDLDASKVFAALLSYPGSSGQVRDYRKAVIEKLKAEGAMSIMATDLLRWPC